VTTTRRRVEAQTTSKRQELCPREDSLLLVVDVQERLLPHIFEKERVLENCRRLIQTANVLGVPILLTEQYPQGIGRTVKEITDLLPGAEPIEKVSFSCCGDPAFLERLAALGKRTVIVCGIEAHVCITQTTLELLAGGYFPYVVGDAISSRTRENWEAGVARMQQAGATLGSTEMVAFELLRRAATDEFRQILSLFR